MVPLEYHPRPPLKSSLVKTHHVPTTFYRPLRTFKNPWPSDLPPSKVFPHAFWRPDPDHEDDLIDEVRGLKEDVDRDKEGVEFPVKCLRWDQSPTTRNNKWAKKAEGKVRSCWLGHAGVLVMIPLDSENGEEVGVLFDPVFEDRCSPSGNFGPIRDIQSPCAVEDLPPIHLVMISHNHYDHLSLPTTLALYASNKESIRWLVPLGLKSWFISSGIPKDRVIEMDWWDEASFNFPLSSTRSSATDSLTSSSESTYHSASSSPPSSIKHSIRVACTPCQHGSGRLGWDRSTSLWCSWAVGVEAPGKQETLLLPNEGKGAGDKEDQRPTEKDWDKMVFTMYFAGDTGYRQFGVEDHKYTCPAFAETAQTLTSNFSLLFLPISPGSSLPYLSSFVPYPFSNVSKWFTDEMVNLGVLTSGVHMTPRDAVEMMSILGTGGGRGVAIHWGTWGGTSLALLTRRWLWSEMRKAAMPKSGPGGFELWDVGDWKVVEWNGHREA